jgi:hypothetical protein
MLPFGKMVGSVSEKVVVDSAETLVTTCQYVGNKRPHHFLIVNAMETSDLI